MSERASSKNLSACGGDLLSRACPRETNAEYFKVDSSG